MTIYVIIAWLVIGSVIGGLAHLLVPGRQRIGVLAAMIFGMAGSLLGGIVTAELLGPGHVINTFVVALVVSALLIRAVTRPAYSPRPAGARPSLIRHYKKSHIKER
jgi:uncharacterized membrane protein YeaQ/YmgE (transglycosylase-associated protein family)